MYILLNFTPICLRVVSITISYLLKGTISTSLQGVINYIMIVDNFLVFPLYLIIANGVYIFKKNKPCFMSFIISIVICLVLSAIRYLYWGFYFGNILNPDNITIMIAKGTIVIPIMILSLGFFVIFLLKKINVKKTN